MDPVHSYDVLLSFFESGEHVFGVRLSALLISNSVLLMAFFMAEGTAYFELARIFLPVIGIAICIGIVIALIAGAKQMVGMLEALCKIEQEQHFTYMKDKAIRPLTDIGGVSMTRKKHPWKIGWYASPGFGLPFIIIWGLCLASL